MAVLAPRRLGLERRLARPLAGQRALEPPPAMDEAWLVLRQGMVLVLAVEHRQTLVATLVVGLVTQGGPSDTLS